MKKIIQKLFSHSPDDRPSPDAPLTYGEMEDAAIRRTHIISHEIKRAFEFMENYPKSVTILGSARIPEDNPYYAKARRLAQRISTELKYTVITGGGPGIMEAANRGAFEAKGTSIGINIKLPREQHPNVYLTAFVNFYYFFTRKVSLFFSAEAYIAFPGGFGTFDELFEIITLVQTKKIPRVPIILVGSDFWNDFDAVIRKQAVERVKTINLEEMSAYTITDNDDEILDIIKRAPLRRE
jgi:uncharacterized protein (TIGR00730 family)